MNGHDFHLSNVGSFVLLVPCTEDADAWAKENLPYAIQHGGGYAIEHRYLSDIVDGARSDGLSTEGYA